MNTLSGSNIQYSVTIHINSIWIRRNSLWQTEYCSYLTGISNSKLGEGQAYLRGVAPERWFYLGMLQPYKPILQTLGKVFSGWGASPGCLDYSFIFFSFYGWATVAPQCLQKARWEKTLSLIWALFQWRRRKKVYNIKTWTKFKFFFLFFSITECSSWRCRRQSKKCKVELDQGILNEEDG